MRFLSFLTVLCAMTVAVPGHAKTISGLGKADLTALMSQAIPPSRPPLVLPLVEDLRHDAAPRPRRGIVAGFDVAPRLSLGIGLFNSGRKDKPATDHPMDVRPKASRKAALGLKFAF